MELNELLEVLQVEESKRAEVKQRFDEKKKVKPLTTAERLERIEELLGLK